MSQDIERALSDISFHLYDELAPPLRSIATSLYHIEEALKVKIMLDLGYGIPEDYKQKIIDRKEEGKVALKEAV